MKLVTEDERRAIEAAKQLAHRLKTELRNHAADQLRQQRLLADQELVRSQEHALRRLWWRGRTVRGHMCDGLIELNAATVYGPHVNEDGYLEGDDDNPVRLMFCPMCGVLLDEWSDV